MTRELTIQEILDYEVSSSWFAPYISNPFLQELAACHYAAKAEKKYKRYLYSKSRTKFTNNQSNNLD